jgi:4-amino-4-deoxy-L-arabinose transferase-like glycosyltransferase
LQPLRRLRLQLGLPVVVLIAGAWYAAAAAEGGRAFLAIVANENLVRIVGARAANLGHAHGVGYLLGALGAGLLPWTLLLPGVAIALWRDRATMARRDPRVFALLWSAAVFLPYAVASSKRGVYLLPLYPAVALLIGWWTQRVWRGVTQTGALRVALVVVLWPLALLCALLAAGALAERAGIPVLAWLPDVARARGAAHVRAIVAACGASDGLFAPLLAAAAAVAAVGALAAASSRPRLLLAAMFAVTAALILAVRLVVMPAIASVETRREFAATLRAAAADPAQVHTVSSLDYGTLFYWGGAMPVYDPAAGGDPPSYLLLPEPTWLRAGERLRDTYLPLPGLRGEPGAGDVPVVLVRRAPAQAN